MRGSDVAVTRNPGKASPVVRLREETRLRGRWKARKMVQSFQKVLFLGTKRKREEQEVSGGWDVS